MYYPSSTTMYPNMYPTVPVLYYPPNETVVQQPVSSTTTTKAVTTRVLDPTTLPTIEETTTTEIQPEIFSDSTSRPSSSSSSSTSTSTSSGDSTNTPAVIKQVTETSIPTAAVTTKHLVPARRIVHRPVRLRTPSGYISSELDYGKKKVYRTDYKYRHYYCCNVCQGRYDLHNRSYGCCEWFYGCPFWAYIFLALLFLVLLVTFFVLFGLQPALNSARRAQTVQTRLLNRTQIIYGFYFSCGYQVNATYVPTTLILCTNTPTTTTARIQLSSYYTIISGTSCARTINRIWIWIILFYSIEKQVKLLV